MMGATVGVSNRVYCTAGEPVASPLVGFGRGGESWELEGTLPRLFYCLLLLNRPFEKIRVRMTYRPIAKRQPIASAFTLLEALLAITLMALAGSVLFMGISTSMQTTNTGMYGVIAQGMAQQLMDEIVGLCYCELGVNPYQYPLGTGAGETTRLMYDDVDDYNGLRSQPPKDFYSVNLGTDNGMGGQRNSLFQAPSGFFNNWKQEVDVYYVSAADLQTKLAAGQTSDYRMVEVRIIYNDPAQGAREIVKLKRVVPYVPFMQ